MNIKYKANVLRAHAPRPAVSNPIVKQPAVTVVDTTVEEPAVTVVDDTEEEPVKSTKKKSTKTEA